jgi:hypothetical protein
MTSSKSSMNIVFFYSTRPFAESLPKRTKPDFFLFLVLFLVQGMYFV